MHCGSKQRVYTTRVHSECTRHTRTARARSAHPRLPEGLLTKLMIQTSRAKKNRLLSTAASNSDVEGQGLGTCPDP